MPMTFAKRGEPRHAWGATRLSASFGYEDGEKISRSTLIEFIGRIAHSVDVPVTADIEMGYGKSLFELEETVRQVIDAGIVGINIEDSFEEGGILRSVAAQCERISTVRQVADSRSIPLAINARGYDERRYENYPTLETCRSLLQSLPAETEPAQLTRGAAIA